MGKKMIKIVIIVFLVFSSITMLTLWLLEDLSFHDAALVSLMLFSAGEPLHLDTKSLSFITGAVIFIQSLLGLATLTVCLGVLSDFLMSERIAKLMTKEKVKYENHVIVCGLGNIGFRVVEELEQLKQDIVIIDRGDKKDNFEIVQQKGYLVLKENLRLEKTLDMAGIATAKSIIICTGDDLLNMEVAINARKKRDDIIIVMRFFDQNFAKKIAEALQIQVAFSSSALAAPAFAAASFDRSVFQTVKVETELFVTAKILVAEESQLAGMKLSELLQKDLTVLKLISGKERLKFPTGDRLFLPGDRVYITCSMETLEEVKKLNSPTAKPELR